MNIHRLIFLSLALVAISVFLLACGCDPGFKHTVARVEAKSELFHLGIDLFSVLDKNGSATISEIGKGLPAYKHLKFVSPSSSTKQNDELIVLFESLDLNDGVAHKPVLIRIMGKNHWNENEWGVLILESSADVEFMSLTDEQLSKLFTFDDPKTASLWVEDLN